MALHMKEQCEKCGGPLAHDGVALICSYECTFCHSCASGMEMICPNCGGELVSRPRRRSKPVSASEAV